MSTATFIRSLLIPIHGGHLLLPSAVVAEVAPNLKQVERVVETQVEWLLGNIQWRNQQVPLLAIEKIFSLSQVTNNWKRHYTVILYGLEFPQILPFYAFAVQDIPRAMNVSLANLAAPAVESLPGLLFTVMINHEIPSLLPDLGYLENLIRKTQIANSVKIEDD